ncbi:MAG: hypothetical protein AAF639_47585 [Chloroflexota bacterium]
MSLQIIHNGLANAAVLFVAVIALWALYLRFRRQPLDGQWYGAAFIAELVIIGEVIVGVLLYLQGFMVALPRPGLHVLYAIAAALTIPASQAYFGKIEDENIKSLAMFASCAFLWGMLLRTSSIAMDFLVG